MKLTRRVVHGVAVVDVSGRMTGLETPGELKEQVTAALTAGHRQIVLNMGQAAWVDSSFIGELVASSMAVSRAGGSLKLACVVRRVQEVLFITRLAGVLESFPTEEAAVISFSKPGN